MAIEFRLPQLTESMASVKLSNWLKHEGDAVKQGEPIAEVETDKTTVELEAPDSGVLQKIHVAPGTEAIKPGTLLATIGDGAARSAGAPQKTNGAGASAPAPRPEPAAAKPAARPERPSPVQEAPQAAPAAEPPSPAHDTRVLSTPLAARMAKVAGLDLSDIPAAGGRVTKADVEAVLKHQRGEPAHRPSSNGGARAEAYEDRPLTQMRRVTAQRLQQAKQTIPHFYLEVDCRADALLELRAQINGAQKDVSITVTDLIVLACASALRQVPDANSELIEGALRVHERVDIAVAVATPQGLITPVVRDCGHKALAQISRELKDLSERARAGRLKPEDYTNGTFTISNLGMYGITGITPIVNPPQSCILGVGGIEPRPVVDNGAITAGSVMRCTLAADHRAIDGAVGAQFLAEVRRRIEQPLTMVLGL